jgi:hypothetical protein
MAEYKIGLTKGEVSEEALKKSGLEWVKVNPREVVVSMAPKYLDVPYKFGASVSNDAPVTFDCSSYTAYLYVQAGIPIPRVCDEQYNFGKEIPEEEALPGDLVFFKGNRLDIAEDKVGHVGVYMGDGEMMHAGGVSIGYGRVVREKIVESRYYPTGFLGFRRLLPSEEERFVITVPQDRIDLRDKDNLIKEINSHA